MVHQSIVLLAQKKEGIVWPGKSWWSISFSLSLSLSLSLPLSLWLLPSRCSFARSNSGTEKNDMFVQIYVMAKAFELEPSFLGGCGHHQTK